MKNREIKFRAWDKFQKKYVYTGFHICGEVTCFGLMEIEIRDTSKERMSARGYTSSIQCWNDFVFEQYTGLKDMNGKEIYEGDILAIFDANLKQSINVECFYHTEFCGFALKNTHEELNFMTCDRFSVIGNINKNKRILTSKTK